MRTTLREARALGLARAKSTGICGVAAFAWACAGGSGDAAGSGGATSSGAIVDVAGATGSSGASAGGGAGRSASASGGTRAGASGGAGGASAVSASGTGAGSAGRIAASAGTGGGNGNSTGSTGASGSSDAGTSGNGGSAGTGTATPPPLYTLRVDAPSNGMSVHGNVTVSGFAPGFMNVEVWDATHSQPPLAQVTPAADGSFSTSIDSTRLPSGATDWTVWAWDAAPHQSFQHSDSVTLSLTIDQNQGAGGTKGGAGTGTGNAGNTGNAGSGGPITGGRNFLLGMFSSGSEITSYATYLGYHPEVTYNSSYEDDHHKTCGQPISGLNDINGYPVIISVFTYNADYTGTAAGQHDNCYETLFAGLESKVNSIYAVRIDVEFYPHPAASDFKASFDRIVMIAKKHFPSRIKYIFNPNWDAGLGADYVPASADVIGPDAYNNPTWCQNKSSAQCAGDKFDPNHGGSIAYWTKIAQQLGKTMALPEWGDDYGDGVYVSAVADWAYDKVLVTPGKSNNVVYIGYWDSNLNEDGHLRGNAKSVFQQRFANVGYTGNYFGPVIPTTSFGNF